MIKELAAKGVCDSLILDCGAGLRPRYRREVVNFEIVGYSTTDVIGINEKLPFKDNSFDGVFSAAVLEHVKDPFQSAREIIRVLKPNGVLMAFVPFLQPYHGYPHHYYNMTISGIRNLFEKAVEITELGTNLHPLDLMPWFIGSYIKSLNEKDSREVLNLRLKDLKNLDLLSGRGFYRNIPQQTREELAFVVKAIGYKK
jgi:SAM-dependent methyltransferase